MAKNLQLYRNDILFGSKSEAVNSLMDELNNSLDGELVLARYENEDGEVSSILGVAYVTPEKSSFTIYEESPIVGVSNDYETVEVPNLSDASLIYEPVVGGDTLDVAVHKIEKGLMDNLVEALKNEYVLSQALTKLNESAGFTKNGTYKPSNTSLLNGIDNVTEAIDTVAEAIDTVYESIDAVSKELESVYENMPEVEISSNFESVELPDFTGTDFSYEQVEVGDSLDASIHKIEKGLMDTFGEAIKNEFVISQALTKLNESCGFDTNGLYKSNTEILKNIDNVAEAIDTVAVNVTNVMEEISNISKGINCGTF